MNQKCPYDILSGFSSEAHYPLEQHSSSPFAFGHATVQFSVEFNRFECFHGLEQRFEKTLHGFCVHSFLKKNKLRILLQVLRLQICLHEPVDNPSLEITTNFLVFFFEESFDKSMENLSLFWFLFTLIASWAEPVVVATLVNPLQQTKIRNQFLGTLSVEKKILLVSKLC